MRTINTQNTSDEGQTLHTFEKGVKTYYIDLVRGSYKVYRDECFLCSHDSEEFALLYVLSHIGGKSDWVAKLSH